MDLKKIHQERGIDGVLEALQPVIDQIEELVKPAPVPAPLPDAEAEEGEKEHG